MSTMASVPLRKCLCVLLAGMMASVGAPAVAQDPGGVVDNSGLILLDQAFFAFQVESPLGTLKKVPIWDELELMLDNPYQFAREPNVEGNPQDWPSYRLNANQPRRRSFVYRSTACLAGPTPWNCQPCAPGSAGCVQIGLPRHLIHPLNYNHMTGEELRLLNMDFEGLPCETPPDACWIVPDQLLQTAPGPPAEYSFTYKDVAVTPGEDRIEDDEAPIDFNSPIGPEAEFTIASVAPFWTPGPTNVGSVQTVEGDLITGGDPGEPGFAGFGVLLDVLERGEQYSVPAVPGKTGPAHVLTTSDRLFDPARGTIQPRSGGLQGLRKPSLRLKPGSPGTPGYFSNSEPKLARDPAALTPSNENDYFKGTTRAQKQAARAAAAAMGKALFWDMQLGSDAVQACGTCHFHAGADNRTKNQTNPNHVGGDITLQLHGGVQNSDLKRDDFPFHRGPQDSTSDPGNPSGNVNDVASSMGVRSRAFVDIPIPGPGALSICPDPPGTCVPTLLPDIGDDPPGGQSIDPIPLFQGLRRVEPRNTPTFHAAAMNFDNFWDGRARHDFNGGSVFGASDPQAHAWVCSNPTASNLTATRQIIRFSSLASLVTGPALSEFDDELRGTQLGEDRQEVPPGRVRGSGADQPRDAPGQPAGGSDRQRARDLLEPGWFRLRGSPGGRQGPGRDRNRPGTSRGFASATPG